MPVFIILVLLAAFILWLLLSPLFEKIGRKVLEKINRLLGK